MKSTRISERRTAVSDKVKALQDFKDEVARERGFKSWQALYTAGGYDYNQKRINEAAERFAAYARKQGFDKGLRRWKRQ